MKLISNVLYVSMNKYLLSFQNCLRVLFWLCQGRVKDVFSFQISPWATYHCVADNILPASYCESTPALRYLIQPKERFSNYLFRCNQATVCHWTTLL